MRFAIRHLTRFEYSSPVRESVSEVRMQPRDDEGQRCESFSLTVRPYARIFDYQDARGNQVHHFDVPAAHTELLLTVESVVSVQPPQELPASLPAAAWAEIDEADSDALWDYRQPSLFARSTPALEALAEGWALDRSDDPLSTMLRLRHAICTEFTYAPQSTHVESSIDDALASKRGVCQDFTHIMIALGRRLGIPCRYVSGYLFHRPDDQDRSAEDATHAWMEAWLPTFGWVGFDPTNDLMATERHIRVAVGRDYADVPPTRGTFKGSAEEVLSVGVRVALAEAPADPAEELLPEASRRPAPEPLPRTHQESQQQ